MLSLYLLELLRGMRVIVPLLMLPMYYEILLMLVENSSFQLIPIYQQHPSFL